MFDVVVLGGGPAGAATARRLARSGRRVALIERTRYSEPRIGESLPPEIRAPLSALGLWDRFRALNPLPGWGIRSHWGGVTERSHLLDPYGCGWQVDRRALDRLLATAATEAGAALFEGESARITGWDGRHWHLSTRTGRELSARVLVDATGRFAGPARTLGARPIRFDRQVGVALRWHHIPDAHQHPLLLETTELGWWYTAPLPPGTTMIAVLMTDADLCARHHLSTPRGFHTALTAATETLHRVQVGTPTPPPRVYAATSQRLRRDIDPTSGPWLAVGDAALALDPASGNGILHALTSAASATATIESLLDAHAPWPETLTAYEAALDHACTRYLLDRADHYAAEHRFDSPYWSRRALRSTA
ncbi:FAD-dependent oxidoreductase [Nocardia sp. NPDC051832]|uniref:NAD(P)/FAD-dependent oxidoreductase n=1 Tax=Nocardia sp. NPDC051832 TaxID=3155673 RepID=UPI003433DB11